MVEAAGVEPTLAHTATMVCSGLLNIYYGRNRSICRQRAILYSPIARVVFPLGKRMNFQYFP